MQPLKDIVGLRDSYLRTLRASHLRKHPKINHEDAKARRYTKADIAKNPWKPGAFTEDHLRAFAPSWLLFVRDDRAATPII